jgi:hypothetical protein
MLANMAVSCIRLHWLVRSNQFLRPSLLDFRCCEPDFVAIFGSSVISNCLLIISYCLVYYFSRALIYYSFRLIRSIFGEHATCSTKYLLEVFTWRGSVQTVTSTVKGSTTSITEEIRVLLSRDGELRTRLDLRTR